MQLLRAALFGVLAFLLSACQTIAPAPAPASDAQRVQAADGEAAAWEIASQSTQADTVQAYLDRFPEGAHAASAQLRLKLIQKGAIK